ncbi:MAG: hypothetical protein OEW75_17105, partial [Cyclobacteriaceae bacterium]|nr:hypothetical protein [Cyclobacteriaceae bacterium]
LFLPQTVSNKPDNLLVFQFDDTLSAVVKYQVNSSYFTFEIVEISHPVDVAIWGPISTSINEIIGETVGVVRNEEFAIGIQSLNKRTLGGYPWNENDCMPQIDIFEQENLSDLSEKGKREVLYRVEAAKPENYGSSLQAYVRNRTTDRLINNWGHEYYVSPAYTDGGIVGSKIALFGCPENKALETIGEIEIEQGLAHPLIDGTWGKISQGASAAYIIMEFGEDTIEKAIEITKKAGLMYLYHSGPFKNWGHFELDGKSFPHGTEGLKQCVDFAKKEEIFVGVHTLSNFITTNDPYVSPVPDSRLAKIGTTKITEEVDSKSTTIQIESPQFFNQFENNNLKTVQIGNELIRYGDITKEFPWKLINCIRGSFGTTPTSHSKGSTISMLADHGYKVFLSDVELTVEMSTRLADLFNKTGLRQISFDGVEGNRSTGMGNYGEILFTQTWYDNLDNSIKQHYIADASRTSHFFWHVYSRMNWGEPWYAGFRESQTEYRLKNQAYFKRNYMPAMLGWFSMRNTTTIEDIEWMLARSAAFNAGFGFVLSSESIEMNGQADLILNTVKDWEKIRMAGGFTSAQRKKMESIQNEFHLEALTDNVWNLYPVHSFKFSHEKKVRQPGEPLYSTFHFENDVEAQPFQFIITAAEGGLGKFSMEVDNYNKIEWDIQLHEGESFRYTGGKHAIVLDNNLNKIKEVPVDTTLLILNKGNHTINFDCEFSAQEQAKAKIEIRILDTPEVIQL